MVTNILNYGTVFEVRGIGSERNTKYKASLIKSLQEVIL